MTANHAKYAKRGRGVFPQRTRRGLIPFTRFGTKSHEPRSSRLGRAFSPHLPFVRVPRALPWAGMRPGLCPSRTEKNRGLDGGRHLLYLVSIRFGPGVRSCPDGCMAAGGSLTYEFDVRRRWWPVRPGPTEIGAEGDGQTITSALIPAFSPRRRGIIASPRQWQSPQLIRTF